MKLHGGTIFIGLCEAPAGGWKARVEAWPLESKSGDLHRDTVFRELVFDAEPSYNSFVVTMGELVAELLGEPDVQS